MIMSFMMLLAVLNSNFFQNMKRNVYMTEKRRQKVVFIGTNICIIFKNKIIENAIKEVKKKRVMENFLKKLKKNFTEHKRDKI